MRVLHICIHCYVNSYMIHAVVCNERVYCKFSDPLKKNASRPS